MKNFNYENPTKIIFGKGVLQEQLLENLKNLNVKKVLLITGGGSIKRNGVYDDIKASLKSSDIELYEFFGIEPNPTTKNVRDCVEVIKKHNIDFLLSAGGGSSLDATKAISRASCIEGDIWDIFTGKETSQGKHIPFASVITIPATSSEANAGAVITNEQTQEKRPMFFVHPIFSICDPVYTFTLPNFQTGAGASDIVSHIFEQYFATGECEITHQFMFSIIRVLKNAVPKVLVEPNNYELRSEIMYAGTLGLNYQLKNGLGDSSWDVHGIEHSLSGVFNITHGAGLAILTPAWMEMISVNPRAKELILKLGLNVFNTTTIEDTIKEVQALFVSFGMPKKLSELNVDKDKFALCAQDVINAWGNNFGVFKSWNKEQIIELYNKVY